MVRPPTTPGKKNTRPAADLNLDHVLPRDHGGQTTWENIVCSCIPCNTRNGNRLLTRLAWRLLKKSRRPNSRPFLHITFDAKVHDSWRHFIDFAYWNVELGE